MTVRRRPRRTRWIAALVLAAALLALPTSASAATETKTFRYGPVSVGGYQVKQDMNFLSGDKVPDVDGFITGMSVDVVDANGKQVPISRLMLHHIVFSKLGVKDGTCDEFTLLDNKSKVSAGGFERFYGAGEERAVLGLPPGYGYPIKSADRWIMTWMLMNHRRTQDTAYIEYKVTYTTGEELTPVKPYWLDVENCKADPVYDVPGGGAPGSTHTKSATWEVPQDGRIVAGGGHVHGGAKDLQLREASCQDRRLFASKPTWGVKEHPFYNVKPILHEPGPINMTGFNSNKGFAVNAGDRIRLDSNYDAELPHTRIMGIMVVYMAHGEVADGCAAPPDDVLTSPRPQPGRSKPPRFTVPLTGLRNGNAVEISRPPGPTRPKPSGSILNIGSYFVRPANISVPRGARVSWRFNGNELHDVTLANGPRGFSSPHLNDGRLFTKRFTAPGTYRMFCSLHPVTMTQTVTVRKKRN